MSFILKLGNNALLRIGALATVGIGLSGCTYDVGLGYASNGYGGGYYECDPYSPFDSYYDCDNGYGFSNIGYGGGWYDNYWYPGHGYFLFDSYGRRYAMRDNYRRYWGERRHHWYRENRGRYDGRHRYGRGRDYTGTDGPDAIGWQETGGGQVRDRDRNGQGPEGERRRNRNRGWQGGESNGADAVPQPNPDATGGRGNGRREGRRGDGRNGYSQPVPSTGNAEQPAAPQLEPTMPSEVAAPERRQGRSERHERPD